MEPMRTPLTLFLLPILLMGCRQPDPGSVQLARQVPFRLCPPESAPDFFADQEVLFSLPDGGRETLIAAVENRGCALTLVASTPLGQTLFVVRVQSGAVTVDARVPLAERLDPRMLPALVQFALWPLEAVRAGLGPGVTCAEDGPRRTLLRKGKVVWSATRTGAAPPFQALLLENPGMGLTLRIRTLEE
jgi:Protein of unknown function (DUF3261)